MKTLALLVMLAALTACAARAPQQVMSPPPAKVSTTALAAALKVNKTKTAEASVRVVTVVEKVNRIITQTDPATAAQLAEVRTDLIKVTAHLRDAQDATTAAEAERVHEQRRADDLHTWGVARQAAEAANGEGWRNEEAAHGKTKAALRTQTGLAWKWRFITFGLLGLTAAFFIARQYFPILKSI